MPPSSRREPCPRCGEPAALAAALCPHCGRGLLLDVRAEAPVDDPRRRYQAARCLLGLLDQPPPLRKLQERLTRGRTTLVQGATREEAAAALEVLGELGVEARTLPYAPEPAAQPLPPASGTGSLPRSLALVGPGAAAAFVLSFGWWQRSGERGVPGGAGTGSSAPPASPLSAKELAARALPSTVRISCPESEGSGFFVAADRLVTNAHVLCDAASPSVLLADGRTFDGEVLRRDDWLDLALVEVPGAVARPLTLGDATVLEPGDRLLAVGNPQGLDFSVAEGIVSHVGRSLMGIGYLQVDVNLNPGNSGGPLLDGQGRVVGVVTMMVGEASGLGLALPANYLYSGSDPLVAPPPSGRAPERWNRFLEGVRALEAEEIAELTSPEATRPALAAAGLTAFTPLQAALVVVSDLEPFPGTFYFSVRDGEHEVCQMSGEVVRWHRGGRQHLDRLGGRMAWWLERNGIDLALWVGVVAFPPDGCPGEKLMGRLLHLEDGPPAADRVPIGYLEGPYLQGIGP